MYGLLLLSTCCSSVIACMCPEAASDFLCNTTLERPSQCDSACTRNKPAAHTTDQSRHGGTVQPAAPGSQHCIHRPSSQTLHLMHSYRCVHDHVSGPHPEGLNAKHHLVVTSKTASETRAAHDCSPPEKLRRCLDLSGTDNIVVSVK